MVVVIVDVAEAGVEGEVASDATLARDRPGPVAAVIAEDVTAGQLDLIPCLDRLAAVVEDDDRVLDGRRGTADAAKGERAAGRPRVSDNCALDQCKITRSGADCATRAANVAGKGALGERDSRA